ncbi:MAG: nuclear transport factor 2 family protein [Anaerolineae bacterium]|jgi:hypothetical protein|nr:nuclear transport factor 2 family protein [Anaerolineae bacterium]
MKRLSLLAIFFVFTLSACGGVKTTSPNSPDAQASQFTVPDNPNAKASQAIVENWIVAYQTSEAEALLSLWSDDITWSACTNSPCAAYYLADLKHYVPRDFKNPEFKVEIQSYLITTSGKYAIVQALYADPMVGLRTPTPAVAILEFKDGKISKETWYW